VGKLTRRGFFRQTSVSVGTIGALAAFPLLETVPEAPEVSEPLLTAAETAEPMLAHVRDFATGEISLMVGTREIIYRDADLVTRLLKAAR
jgi:hypothetical protein